MNLLKWFSTLSYRRDLEHQFSRHWTELLQGLPILFVGTHLFQQPSWESGLLVLLLLGLLHCEEKRKREQSEKLSVLLNGGNQGLRQRERELLIEVLDIRGISGLHLLTRKRGRE